MAKYTTPYDRSLIYPWSGGLSSTATVLETRGDFFGLDKSAVELVGDPTFDRDYYVDPIFGVDAEASALVGTSDAPLKTVRKAVQNAAADGDLGRLLLAPGVYGFDDMPLIADWVSLGTTAAYHILPWLARRGGEVIITSDTRDAPWAADSVDASLWRAATGTTAINSVVDLGRRASDGSFVAYTKVADVTQCAALRGSWFMVGNDVVVNTWNGDRPNDDLVVQFGQTPFRFDQKVPGANAVRQRIYMHGLTICTGLTGINFSNGTDTDGGAFGATDCRWYTNYDAGAKIYGIQNVLLEYCEFAGNFEDGVDYFGGGTGNAQLTSAIEYGLVCRNNGWTTGGETGNHSSIHMGSQVVRVAGKYFGGTKGPAIDDITGAQGPPGARGRAWMIGCEIGGSVGLTTTNRASAYTCQDVDAYLYGCRVIGGDPALDTQLTGTIRVASTSYPSSRGDVATYTQA